MMFTWVRGLRGPEPAKIDTDLHRHLIANNPAYKERVIAAEMTPIGSKHWTLSQLALTFATLLPTEIVR